jgi:hypothetical protein
VINKGGPNAPHRHDADEINVWMTAPGEAAERRGRGKRCRRITPGRETLDGSRRK